MALLEARDVVSGYGDREILHGVSIEVRDEEVVSIIGPNGAGKSTLMRAIFGLIDCWEGSVVFAGSDVTDLRPNQITRRGASYVPQRNNIFPNLTVRENLEMGAYISEAVPEGSFDRVFHRFPILEERQNKRARTLSGGQQQMLALGSGLMIDPDVLLIDEPSAGLAPDLVDDMFERIVEIKESGTAVLMVEQNARKALRISDRGYVLDQGGNRFEGSGESLLERKEVEDLYLGEAGR
jgi:branched-chain amino acid transport system ATP-binding protein